MQNIIIIAAFFLVGIGLRAFRDINIAKFLNLAIIYISLPSLIFYKIPTLHISSDTLAPILLPWTLAFILPFIVLFFSKKLNLSKKETGSLLLVAVLGNTSFLGVPLIELFYGSDYVPYALLYDQLGSFLILSTYGSVVVSIYGSNNKIDIKEIVKKIILFPPFLSLVLAFLLKDFWVSGLFKSIFAPLSLTLVPFALMSVGYQLRFRVPNDERKALFLAIFIKTVISPIIALFICLIFTDMNMVVKTTILEAGMGPMITAGIMASLAGLKPSLTSAIVGYGILFSFVTLPVFYILLSYL
jgi:predicted permease